MRVEIWVPLTKKDAVEASPPPQAVSERAAVRSKNFRDMVAYSRTQGVLSDGLKTPFKKSPGVQFFG